MTTTESSAVPIPRTGLPTFLTRFIGREREIADALEQLEHARLLTLTGPGGMGKTRLAVEVARAWSDAHPVDAWFVDLSTISGEAGVTGELAAALGVTDNGRSELRPRLVTFLRQGDALVVLDNCEHVIEAAAAAAAELLTACPGLRIIATSREPLAIAGEVLREASPLVEADALALLEERSRAIAPSIPFEAQAEVARRICERLDGMPLAIELAAARTRALSLSEIDQRLGDRFALLSSGGRSLPERHRALGTALDWSFQLLSEKERGLYGRLSVFAGGWTLAAAEEVCSGDGIAPNEVLDLLGRLVDRSLVVVDTSSEPARYRMLETIREHAARGLEDADRWRLRHFEWVLQLAEVAECEMHGPGQFAWFRTLELEAANLRAALDWAGARAEMTLEALRLATLSDRARWLGWPLREARERLRGFLSRGVEADAPLRAEAFLALSELGWWMGDLPGARTALDDAIVAAQASGRSDLMAWVDLRLAAVLALQGDTQEALRLLGRCQPVFEAANDDYGLASFVVISYFTMDPSVWARPAESVAADLAVVKRAGDVQLLSTFLTSLGEEARQHGDYAAARGHYEEAVALRAQMWAFAQGGWVPDLNLALTAGMEGATEEAAHRLLSLGSRLAADPNSYVAAGMLLGSALVASMEDKAANGAELLGAGDAVEAGIGTRRDAADEMVYERCEALCRKALGDAAYESAYAFGRTLMEEDALQLASRILASILARKHPGNRQRETRPAGLSAQETEVLRLLASGRTNREIAAELVLSVRTVENHIFNVYNKIGARGRAEATAWAIGQGVAEPRSAAKPE